MQIEDFEQEKKYRMPWWNNKSHIIRVGDTYTLYHDDGEIEEIDFTSAHNFKICTDYLEVDE